MYACTTLLGRIWVDQQTLAISGADVRGTQFRNLGNFTISSGTLKVVLSNDANGIVIADAMLVKLASGPTVIDNGQYGTERPNRAGFEREDGATLTGGCGLVRPARARAQLGTRFKARS